ncbi:hypothetical protein JW823_04865 [bacterium]|nr:hypothetical protein [candidate division CSSED10-310 bacterium]
MKKLMGKSALCSILFLIWIVVVFSLNFLFSTGGLLLETTWTARILKVASQTIPNHPKTWWLTAMLIMGISAGSISLLLCIFRKERKNRAFWALITAISFAVLGSLMFRDKNDFYFKLVLSISLLSGLVSIIFAGLRCNPSERSGSSHVFLPYLLVCLCFFPVLTTNIGLHPHNLQPFDYPVASRVMEILEKPGSVNWDWTWQVARLTDSDKSPVQIIPTVAWSRLAGVGLDPLRRLYVALFIISLPVMFWALETLASTSLATMALFFYCFNSWTLFESRRLSNATPSMAYNVLLMGAVTWCLRGKVWSRWFVLGILWGVGFYLYAPCRLLSLLVLGWVGWELLTAKKSERLKLAMMSILMLGTASWAMVPNLFAWETFQQRIRGDSGEQIFYFSTHKHFMEDLLKRELTTPFSPGLRLKALGINAKIQAERGLNQFVERKLVRNPVLMILGILTVAFSGYIAWRRWLLLWVGISILGPLTAVLQVDTTRLVLIHAPIAILASVPFAVAFMLKKSGGKPEKLLGTGILLLLIIGSVALEATETLDWLTRNPHPFAYLPKRVADTDGPDYIVENSTGYYNETLYMQTFAQRQQNGYAGVYQFLSEQRVKTFIEEVTALGLPGNLLWKSAEFDKLLLSGVLPELSANKRQACGPWYGINLQELHHNSASDTWKIISIESDDYVQTYGCSCLIKPEIKLNGPGGRIQAMKRDSESALEYHFILGGTTRESNLNRYKAILLVQYSCDELKNGVIILLNGNEVLNWHPVTSLSLNLSPVIPLGNLQSGEQVLEFRYRRESEENMSLWNISIFYQMDTESPVNEGFLRPSASSIPTEEMFFPQHYSSARFHPIKRT